MGTVTRQSGKSDAVRQYLADNPDTLLISRDQLIVNEGETATDVINRILREADFEAIPSPMEPTLGSITTASAMRGMETLTSLGINLRDQTTD